MDHEFLRAYLNSKLDTTVKIRSAKQTFPGMSRETFLVHALLGESAEPRGFVFRRDPPGGGIVPLPLKREWDVYVLLHQTPIAVGEPLWWEADADWASDGRPFFVRDLVKGSTDVPNVRDPNPKYDALRESVAKEHAEKLAALHTLDWEKHGFGEILDVPASVEDAPRMEIEMWKRIWEEVRMEPHPAITEALHWFDENRPASAPRVSLVKGNNGLGEEIWRRNKIVAMSDWELASLGDPAMDWAFSQGMLQLWDEEATLEHYERVAGFSLPRENLRFWERWTTFKAFVCLSAGRRGFVDGRDLRPVLASLGVVMTGFTEAMLASLAIPATAVTGDGARSLPRQVGDHGWVRPTSRRIIEGIAWGIEQRVEPDVASDWALSTIRSIKTLLAHLSTRIEFEGPALWDDNPDLRRVLHDVVAEITHGHGEAWTSVTSAIEDTLQKEWRAADEYPSIEVMGAEAEALRRVADDVLVALHEQTDGLPDANRAAAFHALHAYLLRHAARAQSMFQLTGPPF